MAHEGFLVTVPRRHLDVASGSPPHAEVQQAARLEKDYPVQPVPFTAVHLNDVFWAPRIETNRTATHSRRRSSSAS